MGFEPLLPISSRECLSTKQPSTLRKRMESCLSLFFFSFQKFTSESEKPSYWNKYFPQKGSISSSQHFCIQTNRLWENSHQALLWSLSEKIMQGRIIGMAFTKTYTCYPLLSSNTVTWRYLGQRLEGI